jgi:hypothetical protein
MSSERIRELLAELRQEAGSATIDTDTRAALRQLDADIHRLLDPADEANEGEDLVERARQIEAELAANHPLFERCMREVIDALVKIGV